MKKNFRNISYFENFNYQVNFRLLLSYKSFFKGIELMSINDNNLFQFLSIKVLYKVSKKKFLKM